MLSLSVRIICLVSAIAAMPAMAHAEGDSIQVIKVRGQVDIYDAQGQLREHAKAGTILNANDTIRTSENGTVAIRSSLGDTYVMDAASTARVRQEKSTFEQILGKICYFFTPGLKSERTVRVQTATLGVRGTTFLVNAAQDDTKIGLKEGSLQIDSTGEGFNVYQRKEQDDFEAFKQQQRAGVQDMKKEFEKYRAQTREEFVAFKKGLTLKANQSLTISGDKAVIDTLDEDTTKAIQRFEEFIRPQQADHPAAH